MHLRSIMPDLRKVFDEGLASLGSEKEAGILSRAYTQLEKAADWLMVWWKSWIKFMSCVRFGWQIWVLGIASMSCQKRRKKKNVVEAKQFLYENGKTVTSNSIAISWWWFKVGLNYLVNETEHVLLILQTWNDEKEVQGVCVQWRKKGEEFI